MAIVYTTGTINQPDTGSLGLAMIEKMRDDITAHAAWDLVEEFTAAAGTVRWYVLKCLAAQSGLPSDFYVVLSRTLATGEIRVFICEDYNAGSHTATFYAPGGYSSSFLYDATGRHTVPFVLSTVPPAGSGGGTPTYCNWVPSGTSTKWWICVSEDGFTVAFNGASNGFFHAGAYTPLCALPILLPIQLMGSSSSAGSLGPLTRNPAIANLNYSAAGLIFQGGSGTSTGNGPLLGFASDLRYNDKLNGGSRPIAEQGMVIYQYSQGDQANTGYALGKQKRMRVTNLSAPSGFAFGDAYVLQGRLWVPYNPTDARMWDTGVASS